MSEQNKAVALRFIEAMGSNDPVTAGECMAPDGVAVAMGTSRFAGVRSRDLIIASIEAFKQMMPGGLRFTVKTVTAEGDRVVVEAEGNAVTGEGESYHNRYVFVVTLKDGKIREFKEYFCTKLADEVLWPMAQKAGGLEVSAG